MNKNKLKPIWIVVIIVSSILIILSISIATYEIIDAKNYCNSINESYKVSMFQHTCNNQVLIKTTNGWIKQSEIPNFNITIE